MAIEANGAEIQVINTHLGLLPRERRLQVEALLGPEWLAHPDCRGPVVLGGDFNALPASPVCRRLRSRLNDAQMGLESHRPRRTFLGAFPPPASTTCLSRLGWTWWTSRCRTPNWPASLPITRR